MKEVHLKIRGRVQGVGYRRWAVKKAAEVGEISGWVRNVHDGTVELLMSGPDEKVNRMIEFTKSGPFFARVDDVEFVVGRKSGFLPLIEQGVFEQI